MMFRTNVLAAVVAAASWILIPASFAQNQSYDPDQAPQDYDQALPPTQQDPADMPNAAAAPIDDKKLDQFADAYLAVQTIQQEASEKLQATSDPEQADQVKSTAENDMISAVERSGLQIDEFNQIVQTMAADVNVRSRIATKLQERSGGT